MVDPATIDAGKTSYQDPSLNDNNTVAMATGISAAVVMFVVLTAMLVVMAIIRRCQDKRNRLSLVGHMDTPGQSVAQEIPLSGSMGITASDIFKKKELPTQILVGK